MSAPRSSPATGCATGATPVQRRHIVGSLLFGVGWAIADACPAPVAAQIGQGVPWAVFTLTGVAFGVWLFLRRGAAETEPAADAAAPIWWRGP